ncbi:uncharacterized protein K452DRAFT_290543 [Aplosporella prunicola CBS 121167]|uniref:AB hydrolase-1 domain-containing protein n=1 Tax=Aplosporella prunicola CBS 121167 TaxID=1176127 RepID=A0A6A6B5J4_9PEZI|nr:uncharacterized protein K452DRAFT_290543 [Aplosporella prunicola CBS 121167]KAF2138898.1 hypothetical protein K452DRAFT_290543 [Aplosporella prunicola CBS 121167]
MAAYLVFFVPANPGSIAHYHAFLALLAAKLSLQSTACASRFHVAARSLRGFDDGDSQSPISLAEQIDCTRAALETCVAELSEATGAEPLRVIVVGHGVGAYIALAVVDEWRRSAVSLSPRLEIAGAVGLFPATKPATLGVRLGEAATMTATRLAPIIHFAVHLIARIVPPIALAMLLRRTLGLDPAAAVTTARAPSAVCQALSLARDERVAMADGRFDKLIHAAAALPRTFLHFGHNAGDPTLDDKGQAKGEKRPRPIETSALSDCFYTGQQDSAAAAALVHERVMEIVRMDVEARV